MFLPGSGSGLQISLDPDPDMVSVPGTRGFRKFSKSFFLEAKNMSPTEDRQKIKKESISY